MFFWSPMTHWLLAGLAAGEAVAMTYGAQGQFILWSIWFSITAFFRLIHEYG
jgi:hypothetical protein